MPAVPPLALTHCTVTTALGCGLHDTLRGLREARSGLRRQGFDLFDLPAWLGQVDGLDAVALPPGLQRFDCRNNRLAERALLQDGFADAVQATVHRVGSARLGVFIGTSTSGIHSTELAYRHRDADGALPDGLDYGATHSQHAPTAYLRARFGLDGPGWAVSSACSSSAKVFGSAQRMIASGLIDAALVGGVDSLCLTTLYGFHALQLLSPNPCRPFDAQRDGLSIGEGAAFALLERSGDADTVQLLGVGESSDAHHMSAPHPEGLGAQLAMRAALLQADLEPSAIDYINLHGTATPSNDQAEARAVHALFGDSTPCSSTKGATGHTLGAAGAVEAVFCALALRAGFLPGSPGTLQPAPEFALDYCVQPRARAPLRALSNSFGFGGTNCSLLFGIDGAQRGGSSMSAAHGRSEAALSPLGGPRAARGVVP